MSGHSKWANIRVKKTAQDAKRGKVFTRHARLIEIAAAGGGDSSSNASLRTAIDNAKADSVPNANIERAVKKGTGALKGDRMEEVMYAAMGPGGTAMLIACLTDNKNRTLSNLKMIIQKNGGSFVESSSVLWMFSRKGVVVTKRSAVGYKGLADDLELQLIDSGAEDIDVSDDFVDVVTDGANWTTVRDLLQSAGYEIETAGLKYVPTRYVDVQDESMAQKIVDFIQILEDDDDVSEVFTNAPIT